MVPKLKRSMVTLLVIHSVAVGACASTGPKTGAGPSAPPTATVSANATVSPSPTATAVPSPAVMTCRLPVFTSTEAGWLTFPGGTFQSDPKGNLMPAGASGSPFSKSYDRALDRWLPVPREAVSPDGKSYAVTFPPPQSGPPRGGVFIVDGGSGSSRQVGSQADYWVVAGYEAEGVYLSKFPDGPAPPLGMWLADPSGAQPIRQIDASHLWEYVGGGAAWGMSDPLTGHGPGPGSRLLRLDLKSGAITESWYKRNDAEFDVTGTDSGGHPLLETIKAYPTQLVLISAQNSATVLQPAAGSGVPALSNYIHPVNDNNGMWLGDAQGTVSLYTPASGIKKMASVGSGDVSIAGGCY